EDYVKNFQFLSTQKLDNFLKQVFLLGVFLKILFLRLQILFLSFSVFLYLQLTVCGLAQAGIFTTKLATKPKAQIYEKLSYEALNPPLVPKCAVKDKACFIRAV